MIKPSVDLRLFTFKKATEFGINRKVNIWFSNSVSTPLTYGFLKPVILMPVALLNHLSMKEAESLIIHELTHIKNYDFLLNWLLVIAETIFFFNPFIRIMTGKIKLEREKNCDVQVLQFKYPVVDYAETLLKTAKFKTTINFFPLAAVFRNKQLLQRIRFFTSDNNLIFSRKKYSSVSFSAILVALLLNLFILMQLKNHKTTGSVENMNAMMAPRNISYAFIPGSSEQVSEVITSTPVISAKAMDEQVAVATEAVKKINLSKRLPDEQMQELVKEKIAVNYAVAAANMQIEEKEMIVKEEISGTDEAVTKAYKIKLKNGQWKDELMYVLKEKKPKIDSICVVIDSINPVVVDSINTKINTRVKTTVKYIPAMQ